MHQKLQFKACLSVFTFITLLICSLPVGAQLQFVDSIKKRIQVEKNDTEVVRMCVQLGNRLRNADTLQSWIFKRKIDSIAVRSGKQYFQGQSLFLSATLKLAIDPVNAIGEFENAINIFSLYPKNKRVNLSLAATYINLGLLHNSNNDYETAIYYYLKAEDLYLSNDPFNSELGLLYSNLSITYGTINKFEEALSVSKKGLDFARSGKDKVALMNALFAQGGNLVNARKGDEGLALLDSAKKLGLEFNNLYYVFSADFMSAMYYYNNKLFQQAINHYSNCLDFAIKYQSRPDIGNCYLNISACEAELKRTKLAAAHLDSSAKYNDYSSPSVSKQMYFENYAEVYKQEGKFEKAFAFKDSVGVIKDSLYQKDNIRQIEFRQARFNYEKRQNEILQLDATKKVQELTIKKKNLLNYFLIGGAVTLLLITLLSYRTYQQKQKLQQQKISELETQQQLTATEAVLKGEEQERTRLAKDLHDGLGGMLSGIKYSMNTMKGNLIMTPDNAQAFERSIDMLDSSIKEMRRVAHNMMPESLVKFGLDTALKDFCNEINQTGALKVNYQSIGLEGSDVEQTKAITIYRIVQELINNTMKHAAATAAIVQVTKSDKEITVTVEDDGKGFDTAVLNRVSGIGWSNIQNRVEFLKGKLDVNSQPGKGTSVLIELNL